MGISFPLGSIIVIENFKGKFGDNPKRRWFVYFGKCIYAGIEWHILCTTTARVKKYINGDRKGIPYVLFPEGCFNSECVLDVYGVYPLSDSDFKSLKPIKKCCLDADKLKECVNLLADCEHVENFVRDYLKQLESKFGI